MGDIRKNEQEVPVNDNDQVLEVSAGSSLASFNIDYSNAMKTMESPKSDKPGTPTGDMLKLFALMTDKVDTKELSADDKSLTQKETDNLVQELVDNKMKFAQKGIGPYKDVDPKQREKERQQVDDIVNAVKSGDPEQIKTVLEKMQKDMDDAKATKDDKKIEAMAHSHTRVTFMAQEIFSRHGIAAVISLGRRDERADRDLRAHMTLMTIPAKQGATASGVSIGLNGNKHLAGTYTPRDLKYDDDDLARWSMGKSDTTEVKDFGEKLSPISNKVREPIPPSKGKISAPGDWLQQVDFNPNQTTESKVPQTKESKGQLKGLGNL